MRVTQRALSLKHFEYSKISDQPPTTPTSLSFHAKVSSRQNKAGSPMGDFEVRIGGAVMAEEAGPPLPDLLLLIEIVLGKACVRGF
jgi:hypothetical protein